MQVRVGDTVRMRDGRIVHVTDAADQDPDAYRVYDEHTYKTTGEWKVNAEMPMETIFMGNTPSGGRVVSDMSEVVAILD